jgi:hypothetical protein
MTNEERFLLNLIRREDRNLKNFTLALTADGDDCRATLSITVGGRQMDFTMALSPIRLFSITPELYLAFQPNRAGHSRRNQHAGRYFG